MKKKIVRWFIKHGKILTKIEYVLVAVSLTLSIIALLKSW